MVAIIGDPDGVPESNLGGVLDLLSEVLGDVEIDEDDPAALLGPVREPADWNPRGAAGDEEC